MLQRHGLPDPRGGVFGEAIVERTGAWGKSFPPRRAYGWIIPGRQEIVTLGGLREPIEKVIRYRREDYSLAQKAADPRFWSWGWDWDIAAAMLLVKGNVSQAKAALERTTVQNHSELIIGYAGSRSRHMHRLFSQGDYAEVYRIGQELRWSRPFLESGMMSIDADQEKAADPQALEAQRERLRRLQITLQPEGLTHQARSRLDKGGRNPDPLGIKDRSARIKKLLEFLDAVEVNTSGFGAENYRLDPRFLALVNEGEPALKGLFHAAESDQRSLQFWGQGRWGWGPRSYPVRIIAEAAIASILGVYWMPLGELKALAQRTKGLSKPERWMAILNDDLANNRSWMQAAYCLFDREGVERIGAETLVRPPKHIEHRSPLKAEALRSKKGPTLADVLQRRSRQLIGGLNPTLSDIDGGLALAIMLHSWEPEASLAILQAGTGAAMRRDGLVSGCQALVAKAIVARHQLGDKKSLAEWSDFIRRSQPFTGFHDSFSFAPLYEARDTPEMKKLAEELFGPKGSYWIQNSSPTQRLDELSRLSKSRLIETVPVKQRLLEALSDETVIGRFSLKPELPLIELRIDGNATHSYPPKGLSPKEEESLRKGQPLRMADAMAKELQGLKGLPRFELAWPLERRDRVLAGIRRFIKGIRNSETLLDWPDNGWRDL